MRYLVIRTENLTKQYGRIRALHNLTIEVEPGEVYGVLGPKGAGKTTLINLLANLVRPTSGTALILGYDSIRQNQLARHMIGHLPENLILPPNLTCEQMVGRLTIQTGGVDSDNLADLADRFGLDLTRRISTLSTAERKAFGIVVAFMHQPELVLLDSPSVNLDTDRQTQLYQLIAERRAAGATIVVASQSLIEMERICDRVAVLHQGKLIAVERGVALRARALRKIEMRFAEPIRKEAFIGLANIHELTLDENKLRCTLQGEPDALFKTASQFRLLDVISQQPSLDEVYRSYYGIRLVG